MPIRNSYTLLAKFLSPDLSPQEKEDLLISTRSTGFKWPDLLCQANLQLVTPLWYVNLQRNDLLQELPEDFSEYLEHLYLSNSSRNNELVNVLTEVLDLCCEEGMTPVLLKGASTFVDNLYGDFGARIMTDLDLLLPDEEAILLNARMQQRGYRVINDVNTLFDNDGASNFHHHLKTLQKPGSRVAIEIHYRIARGKLNEIFNEASTMRSTLSERECFILAPEWRNLHNVLHAMVSDRGTLNSLVPLRAVAESAWLKSRYPEMDCDVLLRKLDEYGFRKDFDLYYSVYERLGLSTGRNEKMHAIATFHANRCLDNGDSLILKHKPFALNFYIRVYKLLNFPNWAWNYLCYLESGSSFWLRAKRMLNYLLKPASWKKV